MNTNTQLGNRVLDVQFTNTEAHGIICAAMFQDYNTIFNGADNEILVAVINGDMQLAMRLAVVKLANFKQYAELHDRPDIHMDLSICTETAEAACDQEEIDGLEAYVRQKYPSWSNAEIRSEAVRMYHTGDPNLSILDETIDAVTPKQPYHEDIYGIY